MPDAPTPRFSAADLRDLATAIFAAEGLEEPAAATVADNLVEADLRGVHSHGLTRVPIYVERLRRGLVNPRPQIQVGEGPGGLVGVDGDNGMGAVVGLRAAEVAVERAGRAGAAVVAVRHSNHFGIAGFYAEHIAGRGMVAFVCSTAPPNMAAWGGRTARFGTNPLAYGVPARGAPIVADMATSVVARGKVILAAGRGEPIPAGWALDTQGRSTTDAAAALDGVLLPFGGPKGSAIAFLVDILAGVATGAAFGHGIPDLYRDLARPQDVGHFLLAFDPGRLMGHEAFLDRVDEAIVMTKSGPPAEGFGEVLLPGEIERRLRDERLEAGTPLHPSTVDELAGYAASAGVTMPAALPAR